MMSHPDEIGSRLRVLTLSRDNKAQVQVKSSLATDAVTPDKNVKTTLSIELNNHTICQYSTKVLSEMLPYLTFCVAKLLNFPSAMRTGDRK